MALIFTIYFEENNIRISSLPSFIVCNLIKTNAMIIYPPQRINRNFNHLIVVSKFLNRINWNSFLRYKVEII